MKILALLFLFFSHALFADGENPMAQERKMNVACFWDKYHEDAAFKPVSIACTNAFEWKLSCDLRKVSLSICACGLSNEAKNTYLYDSEHLFYKPEIKNNPVDFSSGKNWEFRFSVALDFKQIFFNK